MSKYLKTYEEWNPFLSKEEKSRRAEEVKRKEKDRLDKEESDKFQELCEYFEDEVTKKYNNAKIYRSKEQDYISASSLNKPTPIEFQDSEVYTNINIGMSNYKLGLSSDRSARIFIDITYTISKEPNVKLPANIDSIINKLNIRLNFLNGERAYIFKYSDSYHVDHMNVISSFINSIDKHIDVSNRRLKSVFNVIDVEIEKQKKQDQLNEKADEILDCFSDVIDLCESHHSEFIGGI